MAITKEQQLDRLVKKVAELQKNDFYGDVTLQLRGGNIILVKLNQSLKLENTDGKEEKKEVK